MAFLLGSAIAILAALYYFCTHIYQKYDYFQKRGIPQLPTEFLFGNSRDLIQLKKFQGGMFKDFYFQFKKMGVAHGGVYGMNSKNRTWVPIDTQLIKNILIKDFDHFNAHNPRYPGLYFNNLFHMAGKEWRDMRRKLTPTFTSGKMKMMFDIILDKTDKLDDLMERIRKTGEPFEIKDVLVRFTTDIIANTGYGIECDSLKDKDFEFYKLIQEGFSESRERDQPSYLELAIQYLGFRKQSLPKFKRVEDYFREVVKESVRYREENKIIRKDFLHLMIQLKNQGIVTETANESADVFKKTINTEVITMEDLTGQCLLFFSAGFGTSSTTMSFAMMELAHNQDVQRKLREEIRDVFKRHNGKLSYEALAEMRYCDKVIYEALRKYPSLPVLFRMCTQDYKIPGTESVIEKGTAIQIPVLGLHMDPDNFPDPEKFIPERFNEENKSKIKEYSFLPFGEGPRMCLGQRFGMMQSKAGIATLINNFHFTLNKRTAYPANFKTTAFVPEVQGGVWLEATRVD